MPRSSGGNVLRGKCKTADGGCVTSVNASDVTYYMSPPAALTGDYSSEQWSSELKIVTLSEDSSISNNYNIHD